MHTNLSSAAAHWVKTVCVEGGSLRWTLKTEAQKGGEWNATERSGEWMQLLLLFSAVRKLGDFQGNHLARSSSYCRVVRIFEHFFVIIILLLL